MSDSDDVARLYFGCWGGSLGHWLRTEHGKQVDFEQEQRRWKIINFAKIDGGFCPRRGGHGAAQLSYVDGWTILALIDYSRDSRPGSNAAFLLRGEVGFDAMLADAREHFGEQVKRIEAKGPITLAEVVA